MTDHVIVVGGGIIGASIAYHLTKSGARVTVLEKAIPHAVPAVNLLAGLMRIRRKPQIITSCAVKRFMNICGFVKLWI